MPRPPVASQVGWRSHPAGDECYRFAIVSAVRTGPPPRCPHREGSLRDTSLVVVYVMHVRNLVLKTSCALVVCLACQVLMAQSTQDVPNRVAALEQQVQKHLQEQKPQLAIPVLREIVSLDPKNVNAQANLGVLVFFQGNYAEAIPDMKAALQVHPDLWRIEALLGIAE